MEIVRSIINLIPIFTSEHIEEIDFAKDEDQVIVQSNESGFTISSAPTTQPIQSLLIRSRNKKSKKRLDTCNNCGHYRFAKTNGRRRIVNPNYPYEHSPKGNGCPVMPSLQVPNGLRMHRYCGCIECVQAASKFNHNPNRFLKRYTDPNKVKKVKDKDKDDILLECYFRSNGFYKYGGEWKRKKVK